MNTLYVFRHIMDYDQEEDCSSEEMSEISDLLSSYLDEYIDDLYELKRDIPIMSMKLMTINLH